MSSSDVASSRRSKTSNSSGRAGGAFVSAKMASEAPEAGSTATTWVRMGGPLGTLLFGSQPPSPAPPAATAAAAATTVTLTPHNDRFIVWLLGLSDRERGTRKRL